MTNESSECDPSRECSTQLKAQDHNLDDFETQLRSKHLCQEQELSSGYNFQPQIARSRAKYSRCLGVHANKAGRDNLEPPPLSECQRTNNNKVASQEESNTNIVCITAIAIVGSRVVLSGTGSCRQHITLYGVRNIEL